MRESSFISTWFCSTDSHSWSSNTSYLHPAGQLYCHKYAIFGRNTLSNNRKRRLQLFFPTFNKTRNLISDLPIASNSLVAKKASRFVYYSTIAPRSKLQLQLPASWMGSMGELLSSNHSSCIQFTYHRFSWSLGETSVAAHHTPNEASCSKWSRSWVLRHLYPWDTAFLHHMSNLRILITGRQTGKFACACYHQQSWGKQLKFLRHSPILDSNFHSVLVSPTYHLPSVPTWMCRCQIPSDQPPTHDSNKLWTCTRFVSPSQT